MRSCQGQRRPRGAPTTNITGTAMRAHSETLQRRTKESARSATPGTAQMRLTNQSNQTMRGGHVFLMQESPSASAGHILVALCALTLLLRAGENAVEVTDDNDSDQRWDDREGCRRSQEGRPPAPCIRRCRVQRWHDARWCPQQSHAGCGQCQAGPARQGNRVAVAGSGNGNARDQWRLR